MDLCPLVPTAFARSFLDYAPLQRPAALATGSSSTDQSGPDRFRPFSGQDFSRTPREQKNVLLNVFLVNFSQSFLLFCIFCVGCNGCNVGNINGYHLRSMLPQLDGGIVEKRILGVFCLNEIR